MKKLFSIVFGILTTISMAMPYLVLVKAFSVGINFENTVEFLLFIIFVVWILWESWIVGDAIFGDKNR